MPTFPFLFERIQGKYRRTVAAALCKRPITMQNTMPLISFTFDDFPLSALDVGGSILKDHGLAGTYYVSLGLLDRAESVGRICSARDVGRVIAHGHELGSHTFGHCDPWETEPELFEASLFENQQALDGILPGATFETMSYPISTTPRPVTKKQTGRRFACCRAGGQRINVGTLDLNYVYAFFLERSRDQTDVIWRLIDLNRAQSGWLIFATHDVADHPTRFGTTPRLFEEVVSRAVTSETKILPVAQALSIVRGSYQTT